MPRSEALLDFGRLAKEEGETMLVGYNVAILLLQWFGMCGWKKIK